MFGQQPGVFEATPPLEPFASATRVGHLRPLAESAGFSDGRSRFATPLPRIDSRTFARSGDAWGFQRIGPRAAPPPVERSAGLDSTTYLASRRPAADIEAMLRQLLADNRILAARRLADAVPPDLASRESLRRLLVVLAPPVVRRRTPARAGGAANIEWLRRHAGAHAGKWVALAHGELLAADESLAALRRRLREIAPRAKPLLHRL